MFMRVECEGDVWVEVKVKSGQESERQEGAAGISPSSAH